MSTHLAFKEPGFAEEFLRAADRGVDVRIILDEGNQTRSGNQWRYNESVRLLREALPDQSVTICGGADSPPNGGGCHGTRALHSSFLLFSRLCDGSEDVLVQLSGGLTPLQARRHMNAIVVRGDSILFAEYGDYWDDLEADTTRVNYYRTAAGDSGTRAHFFPRQATGDNPIQPVTDTFNWILSNEINCEGVGATVQLAMSAWTGQRDYLIDRLASLSDAGCQVQLVVAALATRPEIFTALRAAFRREQVRSVADLDHKYLIVQDRADGTPRLRVWSGSSDFTLTSLRENDDVLLKVADGVLFEAFAGNFSELFAAGNAIE